MMRLSMTMAVGIDLGTTNTVVAAVRDGVAMTLSDADGHRLIPSIVSFHPSGNVLVGHAARERRLIDPENTIFSVKRLIGRAWESREVQEARGRFPFELQGGAKDTVMVHSRAGAYALPEISALVLRRAKSIAEEALGEAVTKAVITVPANFNELQRASTKVAGKLAGLEVLRILNEPTAAALAYGQSSSASQRMAIYDLGGGTFDVTLLDLSSDVFEVLATAGDMSLGGDDFDAAVVERIAEHMLRTHRFDPRANPEALGRVRDLAERLKHVLSFQEVATIELSGIGRGDSGLDLVSEFTMSRADLEALTRPLLERTLDVTGQALAAAGLGAEEIDRVILVGGSTRMPAVAREVSALFGKIPEVSINPDKVVALGAAMQASALTRAARALPGLSRAPSMRPSAAHEEAITPAAMPAVPDLALPTPLPRATPRTSQPAAKIDELPILNLTRPSRPVPPDADALPGRLAPHAASTPPAGQRASMTPRITGEAPATRNSHPPHPPPMSPRSTRPSTSAGASSPSPAQGEMGIVTRAHAPLLVDVTPHSLRVETVAGYSSVLIGANAPVPCDRTKVFRTAADNQTSVFVRVAQGESAQFAENTFLGEIELAGIPPARRGEGAIAVTFELDADGTLQVRARDESTGRQTQATMRLLGANTDPSDVARMLARQQSIAVS